MNRNLEKKAKEFGMNRNLEKKAFENPISWLVGEIPGVKTNGEVVADMKASKNRREFTNGYAPWMFGTGSGLLGYSIAKAFQPRLDEEEKKKQSAISKIMSTLIPLGVGGASALAGYYGGKKLVDWEEGVNLSKKGSASLEKLANLRVGIDKSAQYKEQDEKRHTGLANASDMWYDLALGNLGLKALDKGRLAWNRMGLHRDTEAYQKDFGNYVDGRLAEANHKNKNGGEFMVTGQNPAKGYGDVAKARIEQRFPLNGENLSYDDYVNYHQNAARKEFGRTYPGAIVDHYEPIKGGNGLQAIWRNGNNGGQVPPGTADPSGQSFRSNIDLNKIDNVKRSPGYDILAKNPLTLTKRKSILNSERVPTKPWRTTVALKNSPKFQAAYKAWANRGWGPISLLTAGLGAVDQITNHE